MPQLSFAHFFLAASPLVFVDQAALPWIETTLLQLPSVEPHWFPSALTSYIPCNISCWLYPPARLPQGVPWCCWPKTLDPSYHMLPLATPSELFLANSGYTLRSTSFQWFVRKLSSIRKTQVDPRCIQLTATLRKLATTRKSGSDKFRPYVESHFERPWKIRCFWENHLQTLSL